MYSAGMLALAARWPFRKLGASHLLHTRVTHPGEASDNFTAVEKLQRQLRAFESFVRVQYQRGLDLGCQAWHPKQEVHTKLQTVQVAVVVS